MFFVLLRTVIGADSVVVHQVVDRFRQLRTTLARSLLRFKSRNRRKRLFEFDGVSRITFLNIMNHSNEIIFIRLCIGGVS